MKEDGGMKSTMLQNPPDPEATFRNKAGKEHRGYAANLEESVGTNGSVVTEYQYEQNNHSDSQFIQEHLEQMDKQKERTVIATDGAYSGIENTQLAADKNVELITTSLTGKPAPDILADFEFNEEGTKVLRCTAGHEPKSCSTAKNSKIMQGFVMGWKLFHQIYAEITIWKRYLVGNSEASSFLVLR
ncbi:MAG: hypothetical protein KH845_13700 [Clostridiales bacterium]|nr:hypothetical protein [Clostridiales bacterium]